MNITWITTRHPPNRGGMAVSSERMVNGLRDRGHRVRVLHLTGSPERSDPTRHGGVVTPGPGMPPEPERIFWQERRQLSETLLVGFGGELSGHLATLWGRLLSRPSLVLFRGNDFECGLHDPKRIGALRFILDEATLVGAVSREMAERIRLFRKGAVLHTPSGVDPREWTLTPRDWDQARAWRRENLTGEKPVVGMFGQLKGKKGLDLALELFTGFGFAEEAHLLTVGDLPEADGERLQALLGDGWLRVPFLTREEMPPYYAMADVVFFPSWYDGVPNALLEAMALESVTVGSRAGGIPDLIQHGKNGFLFAIGDLVTAARALHQALHLDPDQRRSLGLAARETILAQANHEREAEILEQALLSLR